MVSAPVITVLPCCSPISYRANETRVKELGLEKAKTDLKEMLLKARAAGGGVITGVEVSDKSLRVKAQQSTLGMFYQLETRQLENEVYFPLVERVDLYSNHWAYVHSSGGRLVLQALFANENEAKDFADLVMSFRAINAGNRRETRTD